MSKKKNEILEEISRLSNADISNFMIDTTSFGDLISNIKTTPSEIKNQNFSKSKNRTSFCFNFDFTKGTMITTLFNENGIINEEDDNEENNNNNNNINDNKNKKKKYKKKRTKSQNFQPSNLFNDIIIHDNEDNDKSIHEKNYLYDDFSNESDNEEFDLSRKYKVNKNNDLDHKNEKKDYLNEDNKNFKNENNNNTKNILYESTFSMITNDDKNSISFNQNNSLKIEKNTQNIFVENDNNEIENEIKVKFKTNNLIDILEKNQRKFYNGIIDNKLKEKIKEINKEKEEENKENIYTYEIIKISNIINLTEISKQENVTAMTIDNDNLVYCGTSKGKILIYYLNDAILKEIVYNPFEKLLLSCTTSIYCISVINEYCVCGYNNGYITLYYKKGNKLKLLKEIKNMTNESIIDIKIFSGKNKVTIYSSDIIGNIYKTKIKYGWFKDTIDNNIIISNENNNDNKDKNNNKNSSNIFNPYYLIEINPNNNKIIGIVNKIGFYLYKIQKNKPIKLFEYLIQKDFYYLPSFFFGENISSYKVFLSVDKTINIYSIENDEKVKLESVFNFNLPIAKIGLFISNLIYIYDKSQNITILNYTSKKTLDLNFQSGNNTINILNKDIDLFVNQVIYNKQTRSFYPTYNNSLCNNNNGLILINGNKKIQFIDLINPIDCINKILTDPNHLKWRILFNLCIQIYYDKHPLFRLSQINNFKKVLTDISINFLKILLPNLCILEGKNKEMIKKEIEYFVYFLFQVELIEFITYQGSIGMFNSFEKFNLQKLYFELLEPYIINEKLNIEEIPNSFFCNMIDEYVKNNNKEWLCQLLIHLKSSLLDNDNNNNENIYETIIKNNLFNFEIFLINEKLKKNEKIKKKEDNEQNIIDDKDKEINQKIITIDLYEPINLMKNYILSKKDDFEEEDLKIIVNNIYDDKMVYSNNYIRLKILWYINDLIENKIHINNKENYQFFTHDIIKFLFSKEGFDLYNLLNNSFSNEYFYTIEKILLNLKIGSRKDNSIDELYNLVNQSKKGENEFYHFIINIVCNSKIEVKNHLKLKSILYFMDFKNENELTESSIKKEIEKFEEKLIKVLSSIESITLDESKILIELSTKCENKYEKLFKYMKENLLQ